MSSPWEFGMWYSCDSDPPMVPVSALTAVSREMDFQWKGTLERIIVDLLC